jgi:hypothetical protein
LSSFMKLITFLSVLVSMWMIYLCG